MKKIDLYSRFMCEMFMFVAHFRSSKIYVNIDDDVFYRDDDDKLVHVADITPDVLNDMHDNGRIIKLYDKTGAYYDVEVRWTECKTLGRNHIGQADFEFTFGSFDED